MNDYQVTGACNYKGYGYKLFKDCNVAVLWSKGTKSNFETLTIESPLAFDQRKAPTSTTILTNVARPENPFCRKLIRQS